MQYLSISWMEMGMRELRQEQCFATYKNSQYFSIWKPEMRESGQKKQSSMILYWWIFLVMWVTSSFRWLKEISDVFPSFRNLSLKYPMIWFKITLSKEYFRILSSWTPLAGVLSTKNTPCGDIRSKSTPVGDTELENNPCGVIKFKNTPCGGI